MTKVDPTLAERILSAQPRPSLRHGFAKRVARQVRANKARRSSAVMPLLWIAASAFPAPALLTSSWVVLGGLAAVPIVFGLTLWGPRVSIRVGRPSA
jgi:hypothetical protein